jgi:hypothetical protein
MTILDDLMPVREVLPDVNVLGVNVHGALTAINDVVAPFNARAVVFFFFVNRGELLLCKTHPVEEVAEVQYPRSRCRSQIVFRLCC